MRGAVRSAATTASGSNSGTLTLKFAFGMRIPAWLCRCRASDRRAGCALVPLSGKGDRHLPQRMDFLHRGHNRFSPYVPTNSLQALDLNSELSHAWGMSVVHHASKPYGTLPRRYIDERALSEMIGIACRTLQRWRLTGRGPRCRRLGGDAVRYDVADVEAWIARQPAGGETLSASE
jgi:predicted DNA-binding transcriptional regulator AlpA